MSFSIIGTGSLLPSKVVTNEDLSVLIDTNDEWISTRTGIKERRVTTDESLSEIAAAAARKALDSAAVDPSTIDMIIATTSIYDYRFPSLASLLAQHMGIERAFAFDVNAVCTGFVSALEIADSFIATGKAQRILIVSAEEMSRILDWTDRETCVLFGDGAGAVVAEAINVGNSEHKLVEAPSAPRNNNDSSTSDSFELEGGSSGSFAPQKVGYLGGKVAGTGRADVLYAHSHVGNSPFKKSKHGDDVYTHMNGKEVFKFAVKAIVDDVNNLMDAQSITADDIDYLLLHQANQRIIDSAIAKLGIASEKAPSNIAKYGNTSSASIPILLDELVRDGRVKDGNLLIFAAFGSGLLSGACALRWGRLS